MSTTVFKYASCIEKWNKRVRCERACSVLFVANDETLQAGRAMIKAMQAACPMRDALKHAPVFADPIELKKKELGIDAK